MQTYISHILAKLHAKSRVKIVREALRQGISPKRLHGGRCEQEAAAAKYRQMTTIHRPAQGIPLKGDTQTRGGGMAR